ncbi:CDGSH iron-sulfur domain-containing protein [Kitasatospora sp. NPDC058218]|uniref:CDGSH iron-sulfur domain-containing protein n=1 Tax=Kitasatospora sp. NPDC058218 TaxID=3346385 RepID=UPI0036DF2D60
MSGSTEPAGGGLGDTDATRVTIVPGGPVLVEGPVEVVLPDGTIRRSDRPVVALCACRRSRRYPFCDTSHRRRSRAEQGSAEQGSAKQGSAGRGVAGTVRQG